MFRTLIHSLLLVSALWSLVFQPCLVYAGDITPDGSTNTNIINAPNGKTMVNIAPPSKSGLSHNKFTDYNVNKDGLILNNSRKEGHSSKLGGALPSNPNLKGGTARVILNEVTSSRPSHLNGYTEISGDRASLIIANPNGISCVGCGFINTNRTSLITGRPDILNGDIRGFSMGVGEIFIGADEYGLGLDAGDSPADIVSQVVKISGNIFSESSVNILTGNQSYDYYNNSITSDDNISGAGYFAVDTALFGGIYANRIRIVATQKGFGVNTANLMGLNNGYAATADNIEISADGHITLNENTMAKNITLNGEAVNTGTIHSDSTLSLSAENFTNEGNVQAIDSVAINADEFANDGKVVSMGNLAVESAGNITNSDEFTSAGDMTLTAQNINNEAVIQSVGDVNIAGADSVNNSGEIVAMGTAMLESDGDINNRSNITAGNLALSAKNINNSGDMQAAGMAILEAEGNITNSGEVLSGGEQYMIANGKITNTGVLAAEDNISIVGGEFVNQGEATSYGDALMVVANKVQNKGELNSAGVLQIGGGSLANEAGAVILGETVVTELSGDIANRGDIAASEELILGAKSLHNYEFIESGNLLMTLLQDSLYNYKDAGIYSAGDMAIYANKDVVNYAGSIVTEGDLEIAGMDEWSDANRYNISRNYNKYENGACVSGYCYDVVWDSGGFKGREDYEHDWGLTVYELLDKSGREGRGGMDTIQAKNAEGQNIPQPPKTSSSSYKYTAAADKNNSIQNIGGYISAGNNMSLRTDKLENLSTEKTNGALYTLATGGRGWSHDNSLVKLEWYDYVTSSGLYADRLGIIRAENDMHIQADTVKNTSASIVSGNNMQISTRQLDNTRSYFVLDNIKFNMHDRKNQRSRRAWGGYATNVYSNTSSVISAGGSMLVQASETVKIDDIAKDANAINMYSKNIEGNGVQDVTGSAGLNTGDSWQPSISQGMYRPAKPGSDYMYETRSRFVDLSAFYGSEYFFNLVGFDSRTKIIGDAYYEHELIMAEILRKSNRPYLSPVTSSIEQVKALYDNAKSEQFALGLTVGVAPTAAQLASLGTDIIWYVEKTVNGQQVLVPELFLCPDTIASIETGGSMLLAGGDMYIITGDLSSKGTISAGNNLSIDAGSLNLASLESIGQAGAIKAGGDMGINVSGMLHNVGGSIASGGDMAISAGEFVSETEVYTSNLGINRYDSLGSTASVTSGGNLSIQTDKNLSIIGSTVSAKDNLVLDAGENLNIGGVTATTDTTFGRRSRGSSSSTHTVINDFTGSNISAGGSMLLGAERNINVTGSNIAAVGDVAIDAGNDVNFMTGQDFSSVTKRKSSSGITSSKSSIKIDESLNNIGSTINAGGNFVLSSGGDATFQGADIQAGGNALLDVGGNMNVLAVTDYDYDYSKTTRSSFGGLISETTTKINMDEKLAASDLSVRDGLTIVSGANTNVVGSNLSSGGDMAIYTGYNIEDDGSLSKSGTGGSLNVLSGYESDMQFEETVKQNYLTAVVDSVLEGDIIDFSGGKLQVGITIGKEERDMSEYTDSTAVGSSINAGGNLDVVSAGDVNISGSLLNVGNDLKISAANDINITAAENNNEARTEHEETVIKATATVGNSYVDAALAANGVVEATEAVADAEDALSDMKALYAAGKATKDAVEDAELNLAMAAANLANATIAAAGATAGAATSGASSYGTGMYASGGVSAESNTEFTQQNDSTYTGSEIIAGGNIEFNAGGDMTQSGSIVESIGGDVAYNIADDLRLEAVRNTSTYEDGTESKNASVSFGNNAVQANYNESKSSSKSNDSYYSNSGTFAKEGDITYNVDGDMIGAGYNAEGKNVTVNVGGDMILNSMQDTGDSRNSSTSFGVGVGKGNISGNIGQSSGSGEYQQTNVSSLIGTESVDVNVDGKLGMSGSVIANLDKDGNDKGNLTVDAGSFEYEDLRDYSENEQSGYNVGISTGNTTIGMTDTGSKAEGKTYATIGNGTITIADGSDISGLNRDTNNVSETTSEVITGALDGSVTIDNRLLTEAGRESIANDFENLDENIAQIGDGLANNIITKSIENAVTDDSKSLVDAIKDYIETDKKIQDTLNAYTDMVNGMTNYDPESVQDIMQQLVDIAGANGGFLGDVQITNVDGNMMGLSYTSEDGTVKNVHINLANVDLSDPNALINVIYHETTNSAEHSANEITASNRGDTAEGIFDLKNYGNENSNMISGQDWLAANEGDQALMDGNDALIKDLTSMGDFDFQVFQMSRDLDILALNLFNAGKHSSIVLIPDNPEDFTPEKIREAGLDPDIFEFTTLDDGRLLMVIAGYGDNPSKPDQKGNWLEAQINRSPDYDLAVEHATTPAIKPKEDFFVVDDMDYAKKYAINATTYDEVQRLVNPDDPNMTDTEFIYNIMRNSNTYMENTEDTPLKYWAVGMDSNCNVFCNTILDYSGADSDRDKNFPGLDEGWDDYLPDYTIINPRNASPQTAPARQ